MTDEEVRQVAREFKAMGAYASQFPDSTPHTHYHHHADGQWHMHEHDHERVTARTWRRHEIAAHHHEHEDTNG